MLKNNKLGLAALLLGFGLVVTQSAFTADESVNSGKKVKLAFHYEGPQPMTEADVEDESNWVYGEDECSAGTELACAIQIESTFVDNPTGPNPTLKSSANLSANPSPAAPILTGSADSGNVIYNREAN